MKPPSVDYAEKCPLYQSIHALLSPSVSKDQSLPPDASGVAAPLQALSASGCELALYRRADALPAVWDELLPPGQQMMARTYLRAQEEAPAEGMGYAYLLFYQEDKAVGLAACQLMEFRALRQIQSLQRKPEGPLAQRIWGRIKQAVARRANYNLIICGATQFTGQHAFVFDSARLAPGEAMALLDEALQVLARSLENEGWRAGGILIKDLERGGPSFLHALEGQGYAAFPFEPNMVLPLRPEWATFDDYLQAMVSKYRVRARRAFKKGKALELREMDLDSLLEHREEVHRLYDAIASRADFNMLSLPKEYFSALKQAMPGQFRVFGYYLKGKLVGFFTTLNNAPEMEAHFIGFDPEVNLDHQLYLNMLYSMVRIGLEEEKGVEKIVFSRTALEIKSSVGAEPVHMYCCLRHQNPFINHLLPGLVRWLEPEEAPWQQRHPFGH